MNEIENKKINVGIRLLTMFLDHFIMTFIAMVFLVPQMISTFAKAINVTHEQTNIASFNIWSYIGILGLAIYLCKDCINGRSISKRILKLQIVDYKSGKAASPIKCFIRNIFCLIWPIEAIVALINTSRRIGDIVAGTKLVIFEQSQEKQKVKIEQIIIAFVLSYCLMFFCTLPFNTFQSKIKGVNIKYIENSYNSKSSQQIEKLFNDSLGQYLTASVKVFDKIENKPYKYVSVIFYLKENYIEDIQNYNKIESIANSLLFSVVSKNNIVGQVKYIYQTKGKTQINTNPINWALQNK